MLFQQYAPRTWQALVIQSIVVLATIGIAALFSLLINPLIDAPTLLPFFVAVLFNAYLYGLGVGLFTIAVCSILSGILLFPPAGTLTIDNPGALLRLVLFIVVAAPISWVAAAQRQARMQITNLLIGEHVLRREAEQARALAEDGQRRLAFLADASAALASSLDYTTTLQKVARLAVPLLADCCFFDLLLADGQTQRVAWAYRDPASDSPLQEVQPDAPPLAAETHPVARVLRTGQAELWSQGTAGGVQAAATSAHPGPLAGEHVCPSWITVPVRSRDQTMGALTFCRQQSEHSFTRVDLELTEELAHRVAVAIENARLFQATELARQQEEQFRQVQELSLDAMTILRSVRDADGAIIDFVWDYANPAASYLLKHPVDELVGHRLLTVLPGNKPGLFDRYVQVVETGRPVDSEIFYSDDNIEGWFRNITIKFGDGVAIFFRDITERKRNEEALRFLTEASRVLTTSLDYTTTLTHLSELIVPLLADYTIIYIVLDEHRMKRIATAHADAQKAALLEQLHQSSLDWTTDPTVGRAIRTGTSQLVPHLTPQELDSLILDPVHRQIVQQLGPCSFMIVPLLARGRTLGAILFTTTDASGRRYTQSDLPLAEELARRAALAVDNARLYRAEQAARVQAEVAATRVEQLYRLAAAMAEALTPQEVAELVVAQGRAVLGAYGGGFAILAEQEDCLVIVNSVGYATEVIELHRRIPLSIPGPLSDAVRTRNLVLIESREHLAADYPAVALEPSSPTSAIAVIPLIVENRVLGTLGLSFDHPRNFDADDRAFLYTLGQQCAQALERARLYEAERQARAAAETTLHQRDQLFSLLSHDLKTPLTVIQGYANLLQRQFEKQDGAENGSIKRATSRIISAVEQMTSQIQELSDIAHLQLGQTITLNWARVDLVALVEQVIATCQATSEHHTIRLLKHCSTLIGEVDSARFTRVLNNLISNAIKYSPAGSEITVMLTTEEDEDGTQAVLSVQDQGMGIPAEDLPFIFEPFRRAKNAREKTIGTGLGLSSVQKIVERHGGTVTVQSQEGQGATFTVRLPLQAARQTIQEPAVVSS